MNPRHPTHLLQTWELLHFLPVGGNMCCLCLCIWILLFVCTETWSLYVTLATLKLTMQNRLALNSQSSSFLSLQSAGIKGRQCPVWLWVWFLRLNILPSSSHHVAANDRFFFCSLYLSSNPLCEYVMVSLSTHLPVNAEFTPQLSYCRRSCMSLGVQMTPWSSLGHWLWVQACCFGDSCRLLWVTWAMWHCSFFKPTNSQWLFISVSLLVSFPERE